MDIFGSKTARLQRELDQAREELREAREALRESDRRIFDMVETVVKESKEKESLEHKNGASILFLQNRKKRALAPEGENG